MEESPTLASVVGDKPPNSTSGANGASTSLGDSSDPEKSGLSCSHYWPDPSSSCYLGHRDSHGSTLPKVAAAVEGTFRATPPGAEEEEAAASARQAIYYNFFKQ